MYKYTCRNIINNNDERPHFFRKIYLSHFIQKGCERVVCERWVGDGTDCNILTPASSGYSSTSSSFCWATQSGSWGPKPSVWSWFSLRGQLRLELNSNSNFNYNWLSLEFSVAPGYIIVWRSPAYCERRICTEFNPFTVKVISWYLRPDAPVSRLTAGSKANMLHIMQIRKVHKNVLDGIWQSRFKT